MAAKKKKKPNIKKPGKNQWADHLTKQAKIENYPARSVYKLEEIQNKFPCFICIPNITRQRPSYSDIINNLREVRNGKTTLIIAHRISTIKDADKIIIVDEGKVIDVGTHQELIIRCSFYKDMVERQKLEEEIEVA